MDIYIPSKKVAIEYDGYFWHKNKTEIDLEKNIKCKKDGIKLYRIREGLPLLNDSSVEFVVQKNQENLSKILEKILGEIIGIIVDIDIKRDAIAIENTREYMEKSVARTTRWLVRCKDEMARLNSLPDTVNKEQLLFGINQGGTFEDIRIEHAKTISEMDLDGYAVGGLAVGESHEEMYHILDVTVPHLPENKPTYLMGVGTPANILEAVDRGVDFFDCVYPTRNGRHGHVYTNYGKLNLFNERFAKDMRPIEEGCQCPACRSYSRAYIRHLLKAKEMLGMRLCVLHNLYFYNTMMTEIREAIDNHCYAEYKAKKLAGVEGNYKDRFTE